MNIRGAAIAAAVAGLVAVAGPVEQSGQFDYKILAADQHLAGMGIGCELKKNGNQPANCSFLERF